MMQTHVSKLKNTSRNDSCTLPAVWWSLHGKQSCLQLSVCLGSRELLTTAVFVVNREQSV